MASSGYLKKIKELLESYRRGEYAVVEEGGCNICLGRKKGRVLCFTFYSGRGERAEFAHQECLDGLLDPEEFELFVIETRKQLKKLNS